MSKTVILTKIPLNNNYAGTVRWTYRLRSLDFDENGDPIPAPPADRLHGSVLADVDRDDGEAEQGRGNGMVAELVTEGKITAADGQAFLRVLLADYNYRLRKYD